MQAKPTLSLPQTPINRPQPNALSARRLKVTGVLDAAELAAIAAPVGASRLDLKVNLPDRNLVANIAAKALRKAQATIAEHGADNVALVLQGHLVGNTIAEAGLVAQIKQPKPSVSESMTVRKDTDSAPPRAAPSRGTSLHAFRDQIRKEIEKRGR
jgi:hypothetical protein